MGSRGRIERVVVVPRNGLGNRLQAWASAAILTTELDAELSVLWEPEPVLPVPATELFVPSPVFMAPDDLTTLLGVTHDAMPRYLVPRGDTLFLAGHDRGEQAFMEELSRLLDGGNPATTLIIVAGGNYHLPRTDAPVERRGQFYRQLAWSPVVMERVRRTRLTGEPFVALHVRQTDRSREAPTRHATRQGLRHLRDRRPERSLFIAADTAEGLDEWSHEASALGFAPWSAPTPERDRARAAAAVDASVDWLLLSSAAAIVHPAASTFSVEAALASGHPEESISLHAGPLVQAARTGRAFSRSVVTYPARAFRGQSGEG